MVHYDSRKFIDEIHKRSARWPLWSPPQRIEVGTFGMVNGETGEFEPKGSIYDAEAVLGQMPNIKEDKFRPQPGEQMEELYTILSSSMTSTDLGLNANNEFHRLANGGLSFRIDVNDEKRGAFLILRNPRSSYLPDAIDKRQLAEVRLLEDMFLVTEIITCPSFVMGLTSKGQRQVKLSLLNEPPVAVTGSVGGSSAGHWNVEEQSSFFRKGTDPEGRPSYASLVKLIKISPKWKRWRWDRWRQRDSPPPEPKPEEIWEDVYTPWAALDEDGKEKEIIDTISDSDSDSGEED